MPHFNIAVNFPNRQSILTYKSDLPLSVGDIVRVPLGKRKERGCVVGSADIISNDFEIKEVLEKDDSWSIPESELDFLKWLSNYYHYSLGKLIFDILPKQLKKPREVKYLEGENKDFDFELTSKQKEVYQKIQSHLFKGFSKSLIHGVTGSGKTAIYISLMKDVLLREKSVLLLLPEINLTPQFLSTMKQHLGVKIYSYNSSISNSDRYGLWQLLLNQSHPVVVVGVRSSIFLPFQNLGMIIVDEEHDQSFKQDDRCPYHARDAAIKKASLLKVPIILGSATPSLEAINLFANDKASYYRIENRVSGADLPEIELIDTRLADKERREDDTWPLVNKSLEQIKQALDKKEQVLVFVNRLGFASFIQCRSCGHQFFCRNCSTPLKYYKKRNLLLCQHCSYEEPKPLECPSCSNMNLLQKGFGTEKVVEVLESVFPNANISRFDRDELTTMSKLEGRLEEFHSGKIDILVGTQMLSKGHNFKRVNLVVILGVDNQLSYPDFRSQEKVFQQVSQVSGRSGRYGKEGKVIVQTLMPDITLYQAIKKYDFEKFLSEELSLRKDMQFPPFVKLASVIVTSRFQDRAVKQSEYVAEILRSLKSKHFEQVDVFGPRPTNVEKRANQFSWIILLKSSDINQLHNMLHSLETNYKVPSSTQLKVDIDPQYIP